MTNARLIVSSRVGDYVYTIARVTEVRDNGDLVLSDEDGNHVAVNSKYCYPVAALVAQRNLSEKLEREIVARNESEAGEDL